MPRNQPGQAARSRRKGAAGTTKKPIAGPAANPRPKAAVAGVKRRTRLATSAPKSPTRRVTSGQAKAAASRSGAAAGTRAAASRSGAAAATRAATSRSGAAAATRAATSRSRAVAATRASTRSGRRRRPPSLGAVLYRTAADWLASLRRPPARHARRRRRARSSFLVRVYRNYSSQLAAAAGILIVLLSVYLVREGWMIPSPVSIGLGQAPAAGTGDQGARAATGPTTGSPAGTDAVQDGGLGVPPAGVAGSVATPAGATAGPAPGAEVTGAEPNLAAAAEEASPPEPDIPVMEPEGPGSSGPGPLSLAECLASVRPPATGELSQKWGVYGWSPCFGDYRYHSGVDIALKTGDTIKAALGGLVTSVTRDPIMGLRVEVSHGFGLVTVYACLGTVLVSEGDEVVTGQALGKAGAPGLGEADQGVHLHYEMRENGETIDPTQYLKG